MIQRATASDLPDSGSNECLIRIAALKRTYGCDSSFLQFFTDEQDGYLAIMDGVAILSAPTLTDEWTIFLNMHPDIHTVHCPGSLASNLNGWQGREGVVMRYTGNMVQFEDERVLTTVDLPAVHRMLQEYFPGIAPLEYWYPDASHRLRHGHSHIACIFEDNQVISTAMSIAETATEAIIGQVATATSFRRQGLAQSCIKSVILQCKGKTLYILPLNESAARLYQKLGFIQCGTWAELHRQRFKEINNNEQQLF